MKKIGMAVQIECRAFGLWILWSPGTPLCLNTRPEAGTVVAPPARDCLKTLQNLCRRANSPSGSRLGTNHRSSGKFFRFSYLRQVIDLSPQKIRKQS